MGQRESGGFRPIELFSLGVGTIVGVGWIVAVADWIERAGPAGAALAFALGGLTVAIIARCYSEAIINVPRHGGEMAIADQYLGAPWAYPTGCLLLLAYLGAIAFEAAALGWMLTEIVNSLGLNGSSVFIVVPQISAALALLIINARGVRAIGSTQLVLTLIKIIGFLAMVALGLYFGTAANLTPPLSAGQQSSSFYSIILLAASTPFWFAGFNIIAQAAVDRDASVTPRQVARAMVSSLIAATLLYICMIFAVGSLLPRPLLTAQALPAADAFALASGWPLLKTLVLAIGILGILAAWNAMIFATIRISSALWTNLNGRQLQDTVSANPGCTQAALMLSGAVALIGIIIGRPAMNPAIHASAAGLTLVFSIVCLAVLTHRISRGQSRVIPVLGALLAVGLFITLTLLPPLTTGKLSPELVVIACFTATCVGLWLYIGRFKRSYGKPSN